MVRRAVLLIALTVLFASTSFAQRIVCDFELGCLTPPSGSPDYGTDPQHPTPAGSSGPIFNGWGQEPFRNADMGPQGVVLSTGEFQITVTDLEVPGRGMPFRISRTYRSRKDAEKSLLGYNWSLNYDEYLTPGRWGTGIGCPAIEWRMGNGYSDTWIDICGGEATGWKAFMGFFGRIRSRDPNPGYQIRYSDGTLKTFDQPGRDALNQDIWLLTRIEDRNGNKIIIHHNVDKRGIDWITDTLGRVYTFDYDSVHHRINSITDFRGRTVTYAYDGDGNLTSVTSPTVSQSPGGIDIPFSSGKTTNYTYLGNGNGGGCTHSQLTHNLKTIVDPGGHTVLTNNYTYSSSTVPECGVLGSPIDIIHDQTYRGGNFLYEYTTLSPEVYPDANVATSRVTVKDANGNIQIHDFNTQGNPTSITYKMNRGTGHPVRTLPASPAVSEPDYVETNRYVVDSHGEQPMLVSEHSQSNGYNIDSSGNFAEYSSGMTESIEYYDQQSTAVSPDIFQKGNVIRVTRSAGPRGVTHGPTSVVIEYEYEPLFNQVSKIYDPRESLTPKGRYTQFTYDYQERTNADLNGNTPPDTVKGALWWPNNEVANFLATEGGLGDLNGDDSPHAYQRKGNVIKISEGTTTDFNGTVSSSIETYFVYNGFGLPTIRRDAEFNQTQFAYFKEKDPDGDGVNSGTVPDPGDGRSLSTEEGSEGGGYLKEQVADANVSTGSLWPAASREGGQNPTCQNIHTSYQYDSVGNVTRVTDGRGNSTKRVFNELNQVVQTIHDEGAGHLNYQEMFVYDVDDNLKKHLVEQRDEPQQTVPTGTRQYITQNIDYDDQDRKKSESVVMQDAPDEVSLTTRFEHDANGNLTRTIFPTGNVIARTYDERDLLFQEISFASCTVTCAATCGACSPVNPSSDSVTTYYYDGSGNIIQVTDPEGHISRTRYDGFGRSVNAFDTQFQKTTREYDVRGNITLDKFEGLLGGPFETDNSPPPSPYPKLSEKAFDFDELGRLRKAETKFFKFDSGTPTDIGDGWSTTKVKYDLLGRAIQVIDDNGQSTEIRYDGVGRRLNIIADLADASMAQGHPNDRNGVDFQYDANGNVTQITEKEYGTDRTGASPRYLDVQQHVTSFTYDALNRQISSVVVGRTVPAPNPPVPSLITAIAYDSRGNKIQVTGPGPAPTAPNTEPMGNRTKYYYDRLNRLIRKEEGYLSDGATDATPGSGTQSLINTSNPDGIITTLYGYDSNSRLISITDDNARATSYTYDNLGRQQTINYPDGSSRSIAYNKDSLPISWSRSSGTGYALTGTLLSNTLHQIKQIDANYANAPDFAGTRRQMYEFDGLGRLTKAKDDFNLSDNVIDSEVVLTYNSLGNVLTEQQIWRDNSSGSEVRHDNTVSSVYDGVGFRTSLQYPVRVPDSSSYPNETVNFYHDKLNRLESIDDSYTEPIKYDYVGLGRILNRIYPNGTKLTMLKNSTTDTWGDGYDAYRRIIDFSNTTAPGTQGFAEFTYGYDNSDNRLFERRMHQASGSDRIGEIYKYDVADRMKERYEGSVNDTGQNTYTTPTQSFALDGLGNWKTHTKTGSSYSQTINSKNQYTVFNGPAGQKSLQYDFKGNLINEIAGGAQQQYVYDFLNRLTNFIDWEYNTTTYRYDALGRRISKSMLGSFIINYVYDGSRLIQERDGANNPINSYLYGIGTDEILTRRQFPVGPSPDIFYHTNALGSVTAVTSSTGAVLERYKYDAYGQVTFMNPSTFTPLTASSTGNNILFTARYYDPEAKLYYYRARMYHPYLGRFLQRDPLGESASLNLYNYVSNNPTRFTDPTGMYRLGRMDSNYWRHVIGASTRSNWGFGSSRWKMHYSGGSYINYQSAQYKNFEEADVANREWAAGDFQRTITLIHGQLNPPPNPRGGGDGGGALPLASGATDDPPPYPEDLCPTPESCDRVTVTAQAPFVEFENAEKAMSELSTLLSLYPTPGMIEGGLALVDLGRFALRSTERIGATGRVGEAALRQLGGFSKKFFRTTQGPRFVDQFVGGVAHESKVGYTTLTKEITHQIAKDVELKATGQIESSVWHFYTSPATGRIGPSAPLAQALRDAGIDFVLEP
jgi:RHS repeat-associated protein